MLLGAQLALERGEDQPQEPGASTGAHLEVLTPRSVATRTELHRQLRSVRDRGYATSSEESEAGVSSVAVALSTAGGTRVALNVAVPASRMDAAEERRIGQALLEIATEASAVLHG